MQVFLLLVLAVLLCPLPLLFSPRAYLDVLKRFGPRRNLREFWASELGVVTITYTSPLYSNAGTTTAPTAIQAAFLPIQTATFFLADTDTQVNLVHNRGLSAAALAAQIPIISVFKLLGGAADNSFATQWTFGLQANTVALNKAAGVATGGTFSVQMIFQMVGSNLIR